MIVTLLQQLTAQTLVLDRSTHDYLNAHATNSSKSHKWEFIAYICTIVSEKKTQDFWKNVLWIVETKMGVFDCNAQHDIWKQLTPNYCYGLFADTGPWHLAVTE